MIDVQFAAKLLDNFGDVHRTAVQLGMELEVLQEWLASDTGRRTVDFVNELYFWKAVGRARRVQDDKLPWIELKLRKEAGLISDGYQPPVVQLLPDTPTIPSTDVE